MATPVLKPLVGVVDSFNRLFETETVYLPGSVQVFKNGLLLRQSMEDGWEESGGRKVFLRIAPQIGDILQAYYLSI